MMVEKFVYLLDFKKAKWKSWSGLTPAESEAAAKDYIESFHPSIVYWWERHGNQYARRRLDDGTLITYRISRHSMITEAEVAEIKERKAARRAKDAAIEVEKVVIE